MDESTPILQAKDELCGFGICAICNEVIISKKRSHQLREEGWNKLKEHALSWMSVFIPENDQHVYFSKVYDRIRLINEPGTVHKKCCIKFSLGLLRYKKYHEPASTSAISTDVNITPIETPIDDLTTGDDFDVINTISSPCAKSVVCSRAQERNCFVCDTVKSMNDEKTYRISKVSVSVETSASKDIHLNNTNSPYHLGAKRLDLLISGHS